MRLKLEIDLPSEHGLQVAEKIKTAILWVVHGFHVEPSGVEFINDKGETIGTFEARP